AHERFHGHFVGGNGELVTLGCVDKEREEAGVNADDSLRNRHAPIKDGFAPAVAHTKFAGAHFGATRPPKINVSGAARTAMQGAAKIGLTEATSSAGRAEHIAGLK